MSAFLGAAQPNILHGRQDHRLAETQRDGYFEDPWHAVPGAFSSPWWPRSRFAGDCGVDVAMCPSVWWAEVYPTAGASSRYGFRGYTRDRFGSAVGGCTVKLFLSSDDSRQDSQVSDPTGAFLVTTPYYPDAHWIYVHKDGSPDIDGVSTNDLIGT